MPDRRQGDGIGEGLEAFLRHGDHVHRDAVMLRARPGHHLHMRDGDVVDELVQASWPRCHAKNSFGLIRRVAGPANGASW